METKAIDIKDIVKGRAELDCITPDFVAVYTLTAASGKRYQVEIDLKNKHDVGETAIFMGKYDKALTLMRWIRRAIENGTLVDLTYSEFYGAQA